MIDAPARTLPDEWRAMRSEDLQQVCTMADRIHRDHPERPEVFAAKLAAYPTGCFVLAKGATLLGYALAHPYRLGMVPPLDTVMECLPGNADCLYLHDIAIEPAIRGNGHTRSVIAALTTIAQEAGLTQLALTALPGKSAFWKGKFGFEEPPEMPNSAALATYGSGTLYLLKGVEPLP